MKDDDIDLAKDLMIEDEAAMTASIGRWLPTVVVVSALTGFLGLAWYAYHSGTQSLQEDDLLVVEADKTPMKEKPLDPGGMKFPNQDKTIFETFANNAQIPPKVEKLLPPPEEPMPKEMDTSETQTFVNEHRGEPASKTEQVIGEQKKEEVPADKPSVVAAMEGDVAAQAKPEEKKEVAAPATTAPVKKETTSDVMSYSKTAAAKADKPVAEKPAAGSQKIQLGAYRSEKEARDGWSKMQSKISDLSGKSPIIVKADLGAKGTYYRLRVGGFKTADDAKSFCNAVSAKGQTCMPVKD